MDEDQPQSAAYCPSTPPTQPGELPRHDTGTTWPTILGVVSIVLGILGALGALWGLASSLFIPGMAALTQAAMPEEFQRIQYWGILASVFWLPIALLLAATGFGLINRRRWSVTAAKAWAWTR